MNEAPKVAIRAAAGKGPPIVLLHGFGADRWTWMANQSAIGGVRKVYLVDLPGHGASAPDVADPGLPALAEAVAAALAEAGIDRFDLAGHSLGGGVALLLAAAHPGRVRSLVLAAPVGLGGSVHSGFLEGFPELADPESAETLLRTLVVRPRLVNQTMVAHVLETLQDDARRQSLRRIAESLRQDRRLAASAAETVAARGTPRLTIWGEADAINPLDHQALERFGGEILLLPETGHLPHVEAAPRFNRAVTEFLARGPEG